MDSINLKETQNTPLNCRNTASNTSPITCACCGSKDYLQTIPHPNYFRTFCPGISRCKHAQDNSEENCIIPPFLSSVPLFQPFLHNSSFPANAYCTHKHSDDAVADPSPISEQNTTENGKKIPHPGDYFVFDQKEKPNFTDDKTPFYENPQKSCITLGAESQFSMHPFFIPNLKDIQFSPYFQRCACGDTTPWTCSPFIVPIISYCLFWNSQKCNNILSPSYPGNQSEMMLPQHTGGSQNLKPSKSNGEKTNQNFDIINHQFLNNTTDNKDFASENFSGDDNLSKREWKVDDKNNVNLNAYSLNFTESNASIYTNKKDENYYSNNFSKEEAMELDGFISTDEVGSEECLRIEENTSDSKIQHLNSLDSNDDYLKNNEDITPQTLPSKISEMAENNAEQLSISEEDETVYLPLKRSHRKIQDSDEECRKISPEHKATTLKEQMSFKKFIKNFTITDQTIDGLSKESHIYAAAAGDLGGNNCTGYKIQIQSSEGDHQEKMRQETQTDVNLEEKEALLLKDSNELKENQPDNFLEKNAEARNSQFKSNIAKPSKSTKPRLTKELNPKKDIKESSLEDPCIVKRRHSCFISDNAIDHLEKCSKIQKMKNYSATQQQNLGSGRMQKALNTKTQLFKKEEVATLKVRSHILQKQSNTAIKSMKK